MNSKFTNKWNQRKHRNLYLAVLARLASHCPALQKRYDFAKASYKLVTCGKFIGGFSTLSRNYHVADRMTRCDYRYCNICQFIKSRILTNTLAMIYKYELRKKYKNGRSKYKMLFVTVTTPDVPGTINGIRNGYAELKTDVRNFLALPEIRGWNSTRRHYHGLCLGATAKYEHVDKVVNGKPWVNLHCHITMLVHGSYKRGSKFYKTKADWHALWKFVTGHDYNIFEKTCYYKDKHGKKHALNSHSSDKAIDKLAKEVGKYEGKGQDLFKTGKKSLNKRVHTLMSKKPTPDTTRVKALHVLKRKLTPNSLPVKFFGALVIGFRGARDIQYYGAFRKARHLLSEGKLSSCNTNDHHILALHSDLRYAYNDGHYNHTVERISRGTILNALYRFWLKGTNREMADANGTIYRAVDYVGYFKKKLDSELGKKRSLGHHYSKAVQSCYVGKHYKKLTRLFHVSAKAVHYKNVHLETIARNLLENGSCPSDYGITYQKLMQCARWHVALAHRLHKAPELKPSQYIDLRPSAFEADCARMGL